MCTLGHRPHMKYEQLHLQPETIADIHPVLEKRTIQIELCGNLRVAGASLDALVCRPQQGCVVRAGKGLLAVVYKVLFIRVEFVAFLCEKAVGGNALIVGSCTAHHIYEALLCIRACSSHAGVKSYSRVTFAAAIDSMNL